MFLRRLGLLIVVTLLVCTARGGIASAQSIGVLSRRDHVFDPNRQILYITTSAGTVQRYDTVSKTFLTPWTIGGDLQGLDVTPDGNSLLVCDRNFNPTTDLGQIHRVDANTGAVTTLPYGLKGGEDTFTETGSWDVVAMNNGRAFFDGDFVGSAWVPLHELNLATNAITDRTGLPYLIDVRERSWFIRNANASSMLILESDTSGGIAYSYSGASNTFVGMSLLGFQPGEPSRSIFHGDGSGAISRDGSRLAIEIEPTDEVWIMDPSYATIHKKLTNIEGGVVFDPDADVLYGIDTDANQVVVIDAITWNEIRRINAGADLSPTSAFDTGVLSLDAIHDTLYVSTTGGILAINNVPEPGGLALFAAAAMLGLRRRSRRYR
jgi:DNA-binding beta-propeller fold protein YncE